MYAKLYHVLTDSHKQSSPFTDLSPVSPRHGNQAEGELTKQLYVTHHAFVGYTWMYYHHLIRLSFFPRERGEIQWGYDFLCTPPLLSLPPFHFLPHFLAWSQVLEICLDVVIDFQEKFKGQYWFFLFVFYLLFVVCLLLFIVVCFYVFTVFYVHRTSGPVLQTAYSVRTEGATFLHQLHCKLSFCSSSTLSSDPGEGGRLVSKPSFSTCLVGRQFWLSSSLAGGRQLWVFLPRRRVPVFLTPQYTNG